MRILLGTVLGVGVLLMFVATSHAASIQTDNPWPAYIPPAYEYTFTGFYDATSEEIVSANLEIVLFSLCDDNAVAHVLLDGEIALSEPVYGTWTNPGSLPIGYDDLAPYLFDDELRLTVQAEGGSFYFSKAVLDVETGVASVHNPIPSTTWLFGFGLTGLLAYRRRSRLS